MTHHSSAASSNPKTTLMITLTRRARGPGMSYRTVARSALMPPSAGRLAGSVAPLGAGSCVDGSLGKPRSLPPPSAGRLAGSAAPRAAGSCVDDSLGKPRSLPPPCSLGKPRSSLDLVLLGNGTENQTCRQGQHDEPGGDHQEHRGELVRLVLDQRAHQESRLGHPD